MISECTISLVAGSGKFADWLILYFNQNYFSLESLEWQEMPGRLSAFNAVMYSQALININDLINIVKNHNSSLIISILKNFSFNTWIRRQCLELRGKTGHVMEVSVQESKIEYNKAGFL